MDDKGYNLSFQLMSGRAALGYKLLLLQVQYCAGMERNIYMKVLLLEWDD